MGIAIGSLLAGKWSRGHIETGLIPLGAFGLGIGLVLLPIITTTTGHFANFLFIGVMGGFFIVPLNSLIQFSAKEHQLGKVLAGNNLIQNLSMLGFLGLTVLFAIGGIKSQVLLLIIAVVTLVGGIYTTYKLPQSLVRILLMAVISRRYKVDVQGINNIPENGGVFIIRQSYQLDRLGYCSDCIASPYSLRDGKKYLRTLVPSWFFQNGRLYSYRSRVKQ